MIKLDINLKPKSVTALHGKVNAHINIAEQLKAKKQYEKSLNNYEIALKIELNNKKVLLGKGLVLIKLSQFKDALNTINFILKKFLKMK